VVDELFDVPFPGCVTVVVVVLLRVVVFHGCQISSATIAAAMTSATMANVPADHPESATT
jgi:hypothetical protein